MVHRKSRARPTPSRFVIARKSGDTLPIRKSQAPAGEWRSAKLRFPRHQAGRAGARRGRKIMSCPRNTTARQNPARLAHDRRQRAGQGLPRRDGLRARHWPRRRFYPACGLRQGGFPHDSEADDSTAHRLDVSCDRAYSPLLNFGLTGRRLERRAHG